MDKYRISVVKISEDAQETPFEMEDFEPCEGFAIIAANEVEDGFSGHVIIEHMKITQLARVIINEPTLSAAAKLGKLLKTLESLEETE